MSSKSNSNRRYEVTTHDGEEVDVRTMTAAQVGSVNLQDFDLAIATCFGIFGFRTRSGKWIEFKDKWPGIGEVVLKLLRAIQLNAGEYVPPRELEAITGVRALGDNDALAARVHALRKALGDRAPYRFVQTRKSNGYAAMWPAKTTWIWIDRLPADSADN